MSAIWHKIGILCHQSSRKLTIDIKGAMLKGRGGGIKEKGVMIMRAMLKGGLHTHEVSSYIHGVNGNGGEGVMAKGRLHTHELSSYIHGVNGSGWGGGGRD